MTKIIKQKLRANTTVADFVLPISKKENTKKILKIRVMIWISLADFITSFNKVWRRANAQ